MIESICDVDANTQAIEVGDFIVNDSTAGYGLFAPDGSSSSNVWLGLCSTESTHTTTADGIAYYQWHPTGIKVEGTVTTAANLALALIGTKVTLDVPSAAVQKIDENDTSSGVLFIARPPAGYTDFDTTDGLGVVVYAPCHQTHIA